MSNNRVVDFTDKFETENDENGPAGASPEFEKQDIEHDPTTT